MTYTLSQLHLEGIPHLLTGIKTAESWERKRKDILERWIGTIGQTSETVPINVVFHSVEKESEHFRVHLKYETVNDDWVPAYLLIPDDGERPLTMLNIEAELFSVKTVIRPAVLALHPTSPEGKDDITLSSGRTNRTYGLELVKRGYIVLAPDTITAGERVLADEDPFHTASFYNENPDWSAVAKMLVDHMHGVSLLEAIASVDKIGVIGHSLGGYNAYFLAGIDKRVAAIVCSCGFSVFANDPERERWGRRSWFSHIPKISDFLAEDKVPFEFNEIAGLVAPTPFFLWIGQKDKIFPHWESATQVVTDLDDLYTLLEAENQFKSLIGNSGHDFPRDIREAAYTFLDEKLKFVKFD